MFRIGTWWRVAAFMKPQRNDEAKPRRTMLQKTILQEIQLLPEFAQLEVFNYLLYVKSKHLEKATMPKVQRPSFGCGSVKIVMSADFDGPLEDRGTQI